MKFKIVNKNSGATGVDTEDFFLLKPNGTLLYDGVAAYLGLEPSKYYEAVSIPPKWTRKVPKFKNNKETYLSAIKVGETYGVFNLVTVDTIGLMNGLDNVFSGIIDGQGYRVFSTEPILMPEGVAE